MSAAVQGLSSPYPGLRPFRQDESAIFFGRGQQIADMLVQLESHRFLAVVGASGSGKSSLVRAGLLPALTQGYFANADEGDPWYMVVMRPGDTPLRNLAHEIVDTLRPEIPAEERALQTAFVHAALRVGPLGLVRAIQEARLPENAHVLVLVDQFEELFRYRQLQLTPSQNGHVASSAARREEATEFVALLLATQEQTDRPVHILITMRSDFMGDCDAFHGLPEAISQSQFLTPRLTREQAHDAIVEPARLLGGDAEPALVNRILNEIGSDPDQLPLMQHVLRRLWQQTKSSDGSRGNGSLILRLSDYASKGGLEKALDCHGEEIYGRLKEPPQQTIARVLFQCLSERDTKNARSAGRDVRRPSSLQAVADVTAVPWEEVRDVVDVFRSPEVSFLALSPTQELLPETRLDISHESLLRRWERVRKWMDEEAKSADMYRELSKRASLWQQDQQSEDELLPRLQLSNAVEWKDRTKPTRAWAQRYADGAPGVDGDSFDLVMNYVEASKERTTSEEKSKKQKLKLKYLSWGFGLALALLLFALVSLVLAKNSQRAAQVSRQAAEDSATRAATSEEQAKKNLERAKETALSSNVRHLIGESRKSWQSGKPIDGIILGTTALNLVKDPKAIKSHDIGIDWSETKLDAERNLRDSLARIGGLGLYADVGDVTMLAVREHKAKTEKHELRWMAAAGTKGAIAAWDFADPSNPKVKVLKHGFGTSIRKLLISKHDKYLVAHTTGNIGMPGINFYVTIWDLANLDSSPRIFEGYSQCVMSPDGRWLATDDASANACLVFLGGVLEEATPFHISISDPKPLSPFYSFSPDGAWLARVSSGGEICLFDLRGGNQPPKLSKLSAPAGVRKGFVAQNGEFTKDGNRVVVFLRNPLDAIARVWTKSGESWTETGEDIDLKRQANILTMRALTTIADGSLGIVVHSLQEEMLLDVSAVGHAISSPGWCGLLASLAASTHPAIPPWMLASGEAIDGFCFDIDSPEWTRPLRLAELGNLELNVGVHPTVGAQRAVQLDESRRWLLAYDRSSLRLWDLARVPAPQEKKEGTSDTVRSGGARPRHVLKSFSRASILPGGRNLVTHDLADNATRVWDMRFVELEKTPPALLGVPPSIRSTAFSQEGRWFAIGGPDGAIRVWNINPLSICAEPFVHWDPSLEAHMLFTPDKRRLAICLPDGAFRIKKLDEPDPVASTVRQAPVHPGPEANLIASENGRWVVVDTPPKAALWSLAKGDKLVCELDVGLSRVRKFVTDKDDRWIALQVDKDNTGGPRSYLWTVPELPDAAKDETAPPIRPHTQIPGRLLCFLPDGKHALSEGADGAQYLWVLRKGVSSSSRLLQNIRLFRKPRDNPDNSAIGALLSNPLQLGIVEPQGLLENRLTGGRTYQIPEELRASSAPQDFFLSRGGLYLCVLWSNGIPQELEPRYFRLIENQANTRPQPYALRFSDPTFLPLKEGPTTDEDLKEGEVKKRSRDAEKVVFGGISSDHRWLLTQNERDQDKKWLLWDLTRGERPLKPMWAQQIDYAIFSSDSSWLITVCQRVARVFDLRRENPTRCDRQELEFPSGEFKLAALTADGRWLAAMDKSTSMWVWDRDPASHRPPVSLPPCPVSFEPREMAWSPDGSKVFCLGSYFGVGAKNDPASLSRNNVLCVSQVNAEGLLDKAKSTAGRNLHRSVWHDLNLMNHLNFEPMEYQETFISHPIPREAARVNPLVTSSTLKADRWKQLAAYSGELTSSSKMKLTAPYEEYNARFEAGKTYLLTMHSEKLRCSLLLVGPNDKSQFSAPSSPVPPMEARITFRCEVTGDYSITATTLRPTDRGAFRVTVDERILLPANQEVSLDDDRAEREIALSEADYQLENGRGKIIAVRFPGGRICQIDFDCPDFMGVLQLEDSDGKLLATAFGSPSGTARILFSNEQPAAYRIVALVRPGTTLPRSGRLSVRLIKRDA